MDIFVLNTQNLALCSNHTDMEGIKLTHKSSVHWLAFQDLEENNFLDHLQVLTIRDCKTRANLLTIGLQWVLICEIGKVNSKILRRFSTLYFCRH